MVQVVENRSVVVLIPLSTPAPGPGPGWSTCRVRVSAADPVEGYPNLLGATLPRDLDALVREEAAVVLFGEHPVRAVACLVGPGRLRVEELSAPPEGPAPTPSDEGAEVDG